MAKDRRKIFEMFDGHCAYCGIELKDESGKYMHIDHIEPIIRNWNSTTCRRPQNERDDNYFPSCPKCNSYKHSMSVETFRKNIKLSLKRMRVHAAYNNAVRYGMIQESKWDGLFYFERYAEQHTK